MRQGFGVVCLLSVVLAAFCEFGRGDRLCRVVCDEQRSMQVQGLLMVNPRIMRYCVLAQHNALLRVGPAACGVLVFVCPCEGWAARPAACDSLSCSTACKGPGPDHCL